MAAADSRGKPFTRKLLHRARSARTGGFSLIELVIVLVVIAIIATIAVMRYGRAAQASTENSLVGQLTQLRRAIEIYYAEHGEYPQKDMLIDQLTKYTDVDGNVSAIRTTKAIYGPYLRTFPAFTTAPPNGPGGTNSMVRGWKYDETTGVIFPNSVSTDSSGKEYRRY